MNQQQFITQLLRVLQTITFEDISKIPHNKQHIVAERIEELRDQLRKLAREGFEPLSNLHYRSKNVRGTLLIYAANIFFDAIFR